MDAELERTHDEEEADARRAIVRALNRDPYDVWTRDGLARSLGVPAGLAERILSQLDERGHGAPLRRERRGRVHGRRRCLLVWIRRVRDHETGERPRLVLDRRAVLKPREPGGR